MERGFLDMKKNLMHVVIMVLAVAAVVAGVALFSGWIAPEAKTDVPVTALQAVVPVQDAAPAVVPEAAAQQTEVKEEAVPVIEESTAVPEENGLAAMINLPANLTEATPVPVVEEPAVPAKEPEDAGAVILPVVEEMAEPTLIGRWQMDQECLNAMIGYGEATCTLEFTEDGKMVQELTVMGYTEPTLGTYTWEKGGELTVNDTPVEYVLESDRLIIKAEMETSYSRQK